MEAFIRSDQYNFIKSQAYILANGHATANDRGVIQALKSLAIEKIIHVFENLTDGQKELIDTVLTVQNRRCRIIFNENKSVCHSVSGSYSANIKNYFLKRKIKTA